MEGKKQHMVKKSMLDIAYDYVLNKNQEVPFSEIWNQIIKALSLSETQANDRVAKFYTNLMLDGRFVDLGDNVWDLRAHHTYEKVHFDMNDAYNDVDDIEEELEEEEEILEVKKIKSNEDEKIGEEDENSEDENSMEEHLDKSLF